MYSTKNTSATTFSYPHDVPHLVWVWQGCEYFSPRGRLFQVEYAIQTIKLGSTVIGVQISEGVYAAVEKRITSPLMEAAPLRKL